MPVRRILIVDDYAPVSQALTRLLRLGGHAVKSAPNAREAIAAALDFRPEVVLLDVNLGGADSGFTVARHIRNEATLEDVLLIAITGQCDFGIADRIMAAGFDHLLVKPIGLSDLQDLIPDADAG